MPHLHRRNFEEWPPRAATSPSPSTTPPLALSPSAPPLMQRQCQRLHRHGTTHRSGRNRRSQRSGHQCQRLGYRPDPDQTRSTYLEFYGRLRRLHLRQRFRFGGLAPAELWRNFKVRRVGERQYLPDRRDHQRHSHRPQRHRHGSGTDSGQWCGHTTTPPLSAVGLRRTTELRATDTYGNSILLTEAGQWKRRGDSGLYGHLRRGQFQVGANAGQTVSTVWATSERPTWRNHQWHGSNLALIDVTTRSGANNAIQIADESITQGVSLRANLAPSRRTPESTVRYLGRRCGTSLLREPDPRHQCGSEVVSLTRTNISSSDIVLAQANSAPQQVLSLLR